jgi:hypothetical protein
MTHNTLVMSAHPRVYSMRSLVILLWALIVATTSTGAVALAQTIQLAAYNSDGTNTGTARLARNVSIVATVQGTTNTAVTWTITGAGSISTAGFYAAPTTMPTNPVVVAKATLVANGAISASYQMTLINSVPSVYGIQPPQLLTGGTNTAKVSGSGFVTGTVINVGGVAVPTTFQSSTAVTAQIAVSNTAQGSLAMTAVNPAPGGGPSAVLQAPIATNAIQLAAYNSDGTNTGSARLGRNVSIVATVRGTLTPALTWSVTGAGTISTSGLYTAPAAMPTNSSVTVTAHLASNTAISASYSMTLTYSVPTLYGTQPAQLLSGCTNSVKVSGLGFVVGTTIYVNGSAVPTSFQSPTAVIAQISLGNTAQGALSLTALNPSPGGGTSPALQAPITPLTIVLSSYNDVGLSPATDPLGRNIQFIASVQGSGSSAISWTINWSAQGGGAISTSGVYQAPLTMPASPAVTVVATLTSLTTVSSTYPLNLTNPIPVVNAAKPTHLQAGITNAIALTGSGFTQATTLVANGNPISATYQSATSILALVPVSAGVTSPVQVTAQNPAPGGGASRSFSLVVANPSTVTAQVGSTPGLSIPLNFIGLSHEWGDAEWFMGSSQTGVNPMYRQLVKNLTNPGSSLLIRVGGASTDSSGEPTLATTQPFVELASALPVHFSLGVNLGSNNLQLAKDQAQFYINQMPAGSVDALEIGNEPDAYAANGARPSTYTMNNYMTDFAAWSSAIQPLVPASTRFMDAAWGSMTTLHQYLSPLELAQSPNIAIVSQHAYAGYQETGQQFAPDYLLTPAASTQGASAVASSVTIAHALGQPFRIGEMNSIDGGGIAGISDAFGSALWAIDSLFTYANVGVDGVNVHGTSGCSYCAFSFSVTTTAANHSYTLQRVSPLYYGLLFFHAATANHAGLLPVTVTSQANIKVWATIDASGVERVAILNKDESFAGTVAVTIAGYAQAQVQRLVAPGYASTNGVFFGGQTFDGSIDGNLVLNPASEVIQPANNVYNVAVQPTSAVLLTLTK